MMHDERREEPARKASGFEFLEIVRQGPVERVALNRPVVRNAFNERVVAELRQWAEAAALDPDVRVAVLEGRGPVFSAGADLEWMARIATYSRDENLRDADAMAEMFESLDRLPKPLVGRIHGAAIGGGCGLAAVCDIVIAEKETIFGFTEVRLGLIPAVIAPYVIARIGESAARALFLTGARFTAQRAMEIGLVHHVVERNGLDSEVEAVVRDLLAGGPDALSATKALVGAVRGMSPSRARSVTVAAIAERRASSEGRAGVRAFLEKTRPPWTSG